MAYRTCDGFEDYPPDANAGFCAETGGAITPFLATGFGVPVSTTYTIAGMGAARRASAERGGVAGNIVIVWIIAMPASGLIAALSYAAVRLLS